MQDHYGIEAMSEFDYTIEHIAGVKNVVADALSPPSGPQGGDHRGTLRAHGGYRAGTQRGRFGGFVRVGFGVLLVGKCRPARLLVGLYFAPPARTNNY